MSDRPTTDLFAGNANIYCRPNYHLTPGIPAIGLHRHAFDHVSFYWGALELDADIPGRGPLNKVYRETPGRPNWLLIKAGVEHSFKSLPHRPVVAPDVQAVIDAAEQFVFGNGSSETLRDALLRSRAADSTRESNVVCAYAHRTPQGDVSLEYTGYEKATE